MRVLITGGATRNKVDAIRYLSANATGATAVELTKQLVLSSPRRHMTRDTIVSVDFLGSAEACLRLNLAGVENGEPFACEEEFFGTRDLLSKMQRRTPYADVVIHSAAVGDYEVESDFGDDKIPSGKDGLTLRLVPAPKILDLVRGWNPKCFLVSFKAATPGTTVEDLKDIAKAQLLRTGSDLVFANVIGEQEQVLFVEESSTTLFTDRDTALTALVKVIQTKKAARNT